DHPDTVKSCWNNDDGMIGTRRSMIAGHTVEILHGCGASATGSLAVKTKAGWFVAAGPTIEDFGANMTVAPLDILFARESLSEGTFVDGSPAIVYRTITKYEHRCRTKKCEEADAHEMVDVMICGADDSSLSCGRMLTYECPASGCAKVAFDRGLVTTIEARTYAVD